MELIRLRDSYCSQPLELLAKLAEQLASLQRECSELRRELDERIKVQQEQLTQLAALKAKYDQSGAITGVIDRLERAGFARRDRHGSDRRKVLVRALPAVDRRIGPLFQPMERGAMSVLSQFSDKELAFLLDVFSRLGEAATKAITELNARSKSTRKPRSRK